VRKILERRGGRKEGGIKIKPKISPQSKQDFPEKKSNTSFRKNPTHHSEKIRKKNPEKKSRKKLRKKNSGKNRTISAAGHGYSAQIFKFFGQPVIIRKTLVQIVTHASHGGDRGVHWRF
jgi:hypothetical protein